LEGDRAVTLSSNGSDTWVRLWNRVDPWDDGSIQICVEVGADDMRAVAHGVTVAIRGDTLTPFFDHLVEHFTGWEGVLSWRSLEPGLEIDAVFCSGGHVELTWTVGPWRQPPSTWKGSVLVTVEAGEQMRRFAGDVSRFLNPVDQG
jgi:hypothetical protein